MVSALDPLSGAARPSIRAAVWKVLDCLFFFVFALVTGPRRSLSLKLSDTRVYEPHILKSMSLKYEPASEPKVGCANNFNGRQGEGVYHPEHRTWTSPACSHSISLLSMLYTYM